MTPLALTLAAPCPTCGVGIGLPCVGTDHAPRVETHMSRRSRSERLTSGPLRRMALDRMNSARRTDDEVIRALLRREARALDAAADILDSPLTRSQFVDVIIRSVPDGWEAIATRRWTDTNELVEGSHATRAVRPAPVQASHAARHLLDQAQEVST